MSWKFYSFRYIILYAKKASIQFPVVICIKYGIIKYINNFINQFINLNRLGYPIGFFVKEENHENRRKYRLINLAVCI